MHLYSSTSDAEPGEAYRWRGTPVPCVCWHMYLQTSSQANIVSRPHTLPMSVWYDFHWHHLLKTRCMKSSVVSMQKTVPLGCDLYQMHLVCTCGLATGDNHQHLNHPNRPFLFAFAMPLRTTQICNWYWTDYHWLSTMHISSDDKAICCFGE